MTYRVYCDERFMFETDDYALALDYAREIATEGYTGTVKELTVKDGLSAFMTAKVNLPSNSAIEKRNKIDLWG